MITKQEFLDKVMIGDKYAILYPDGTPARNKNWSPVHLWVRRYTGATLYLQNCSDIRVSIPIESFVKEINEGTAVFIPAVTRRPRIAERKEE